MHADVTARMAGLTRTGAMVVAQASPSPEVPPYWLVAGQRDAAENVLGLMDRSTSLGACSRIVSRGGCGRRVGIAA